MTPTALLVTKHHKHEVIAPAFAQIGWKVQTAVADTDALGTFAGDVPRRFAPLETARRKALLGSTLGPAQWLLASEGSISTSPIGVARDIELVVAVDPTRRTTIVGSATRLGIPSVRFEVDRTTTDDEIVEHCREADLPRHHLVVVPSERSIAPLGGLASVESVLEICHRLKRRRSSLVIQTDFRAHLCPSRQAVIASAAQDLVSRLAKKCPKCDRLGFGEEAPILGLPCRSCGQPTKEPKAHRDSCPWCEFEVLQWFDQEHTDSIHCEECNP